MSRDLTAAMQARADRMLQEAIFGGPVPATTTCADDCSAEPLTIAKINAMFDSLPRRETWAVWSPFPRGNAFVCKTPDENITLIHPDDWGTVEGLHREQLPAEKRGNMFYALNAIFLDPDPLDTPETAAWRAKERLRIGVLISATITAAVELRQVVRAWWRRV